MVDIKSHSLKLVFFLFCLSQVQAGTKLLPDQTDNLFDELFREISKSVTTKISDKIQLKLTDADVQVDKYLDHFQEILQTVFESVGKLKKQMFGVVQHKIERVSEGLKARDPEIGEKVQKLNVKLSDLKGDLKELYEDNKDPFLEHFNELKGSIRNKIQPIIKRWTQIIIKDIEEIILALIENKKENVEKI